MQRDRKVYLFDIREAARTAIRFTTGKTYEDYLNDDMLRLAVERALSIIGEALAQLIKTDGSMISTLTDCRSIVGFRNVLIHQYAEIDDETVWAILQTKLPVLLAEIIALMPEDGIS